LERAKTYHDVATLVLQDFGGAYANVAAANAVLAGIAAADAICCDLVGMRFRGSDHRAAVEFLEQVTGDRSLAATLRALIDLKDAAEYGSDTLGKSGAQRALRKSGQLVAAAQQRLGVSWS
ncbi:MAG: hypothetical protein ACYDD0_03540, partial [Candidatus Dormibacteria bacterium]